LEQWWVGRLRVNPEDVDEAMYEEVTMELERALQFTANEPGEASGYAASLSPRRFRSSQALKLADSNYQV
jgi:hypothetical protein